MQLSLEQVLKKLPRVLHELRAQGSEQVLLTHHSYPLGCAHVHAKKGPAKERSIPLSERIHELLSQRVGQLPGIIVILPRLAMPQPDDHEHPGHGAAGLPGPCHARAESSRDAQRCLAIQTGPPPVGGQDCLGSGESVEEYGQGLLGIIAQEILSSRWIPYALAELAGKQFTKTSASGSRRDATFAENGRKIITLSI